MDFSKYPLEKLFYFVAGIIPGFVALLIFELAAPGSFSWFFAIGFLGYRTKLVLILLVSFIVGNTMTNFLFRLLGAIGGGIAGWIGYKPPHLYDVAPWRDPAWRAALKSYLDKQAPDDTRLVKVEMYKLREQQIELLPETQQTDALNRLRFEKLKSERDDFDWARWYDQYHRTVLSPDDKDVLYHIERGLNFNLETAAVYTLFSLAFVRRLQHWWCIISASGWVLILVLGEVYAFRQMANKWSTLDAQIRYLSELSRKKLAG